MNSTDMGSPNNNSIWSLLLLVNGTENATEELEKSGAKSKTAARGMLILLSVLGMVGNSISILALSKAKKLRSATTTFIVNLCVADLLYCIISIISFTNPSLNKNTVFCRWFPALRYFFVAESLHSLMAITVNRYICVVHPSYYHSIYRPRYIAIMIFLTWFYALMLVIFPFFGLWGQYAYDPKSSFCSVIKVNGSSPVDYYYVTTIAYPLITFLACYPRIFWVVHKTTRRLNQFKIVFRHPISLNANTKPTDEAFAKEIIRNSIIPIDFTSLKQYQKEIRVLKVMLAVLIGFIVCYFPVAVIKLSKREDLRLLLFVSIMFVSLSNVINPIIYIVMSSEYRTAYKELFNCKKLIYDHSTSTELTLSGQTQ